MNPIKRSRILTGGLLGMVLAGSAATIVLAQMPKEAPGKPDPSRVTAGTYKTDPAHTQIAFTVNHLGFNAYHGLFGDATGSLTLDPKRPAAAKLSIDIPIASVTTTHAELTKHLKAPDFFDAEKFPTAHFESTSVKPSGTTATITGNFTLKGVTKPVVLKARFVGAGKGMMGAGDTVGFEATTTINRSAFNLGYGVPMVSDKVELDITVAFEKMGA